MKHTIIGTGNLGHDLLTKISAHKRDDVTVCKHRFNGMARDQDCIAELVSTEPDVIWCTVGAGGPSKDPSAFVRQLQSHVILPWQLMHAFRGKKTKLVLFSTHYLNQDPYGLCSEYARTKQIMEEVCADRHVVIVRVGSLYGMHRPENTLPGKIVRRALAGEPISGVLNTVSPTPTAWLAKSLVEDRAWDLPTGIYTAGPGDGCRVSDWVRVILRTFGAVEGHVPPSLPPSGEDMAYPIYSVNEDHRGPSWRDLWDAYGLATVTAAVEHFRRL